MALMEERKKKLAAEGLFDEARKQLLPWLPEVIGVVTSPTGAVIRDILHRLQDRFPRRVLVWPVKVQGEGSAEQVAAAIRGFNALPEGGRIPRPDLLIVARGGGSLEDLWSFNEEIVVRAAADSMIPLISAVGHETDITLIDFAADKRAPTPTAAAEMAVPVRSELFVEVATLARRVMLCWQRGQESRRNELRAAARALPAASELLAIPRQRLDGAAGALPRALKANTHAHFRRFAGVSARLTMRVLRGQVAQARQRLTVLGRADDRIPRERCCDIRRDRYRRAGDPAEGFEALQCAGPAPGDRARPRTHTAAGRARPPRAATSMQRHQARVAHSGQLLAALSYRGVLARGFALVRDDGRPSRACRAAIGPGARLTLEFADGRVGVTADAERPAAATPGKTASASRDTHRSAWRSRSIRAACSSSSGPVQRRSAPPHHGLRYHEVDETSSWTRSAVSMKPPDTTTAPATPRRAFANRRALPHRCRHGRARARRHRRFRPIACTGRLARSKS